MGIVSGRWHVIFSVGALRSAMTAVSLNAGVEKASLEAFTHASGMSAFV